MTTRSLTAVLPGVLLLVGLLRQSTGACLPAEPPPRPPCETLLVTVPAWSFPVNLEGQIRVSLLMENEFGMVPGERLPVGSTFDPSEPLVIERATPSGFEVVSYRLSSKDGRVPNPTTLMLEDPRPGHYIVSWMAEGCIEQESPSGSGKLVGEFTLTDRAEIPAELGRLELRKVGLVEEGPPTRPAADCRPMSSRDPVDRTDARKTVDRTELSVEFPAQWAPWAEVLEVVLYDPGVRAWTWKQPGPEQITAGVYRTFLDHVCTAEDGSGSIDRIIRHGTGVYAGGDPSAVYGTHRIRLAARIGNEPEVLSNEGAIAIDCDGVTPIPRVRCVSGNADKEAVDDIELATSAGAGQETPHAADRRTVTRKGCSFSQASQHYSATLVLGSLLLLWFASRASRRPFFSCPKGTPTDEQARLKSLRK